MGAHALFHLVSLGQDLADHWMFSDHLSDFFYIVFCCLTSAIFFKLRHNLHTVKLIFFNVKFLQAFDKCK